MKINFLLIAVFALSLAPLSAKAQTTILENFIAFSCNFSFDKMALINDIQAKHDTLVVNCHPPDSSVQSEFTLQACSDKIIPYIKRDITTGHATPFSAINGRYLTVGAHEGIHHSAIALAAKENPLIPISFTLRDNIINAELPAIKTTGKPLDLWLYAYIFEKDETMAYAAEGMPPLTDEERAMLPRATFTNLVKHLENLGEWDGNPQSISIPLNGFKADGFALIAQEKEGGPILALGKIEPGLASQVSHAQN